MAPPDLLMIFAIQWLMLADTDAQQLRVEPSLLVQARGLEAVFHCPYSGTDLLGYAWALNGLDINPSNLSSGVSLGPGSSSLNILATPQYNNTIVQCTALRRGEDVVSENATLVVHEIELEIMASQYGITVSWNNPFTINLSFCVDAKSVKSSETVRSECVSGARYVFTSLNSHLCEDLSFTVTPTVRVKGVQMNGMSSKPVVGYFRGRRAIGIVHCQQFQATTCEVTFSTPLTPGCDCDLMFTSIDSKLLPSVSYSQTVRGNGNTVYTLDLPIVPNRLYSLDATIEFFNNTHDLPNQNITTHDIVNASASQCDNEGALNTSCTFVQNTTASGYLAVISNANCSKDTIFLVEYNTAGTDDLTDGVGPGDYSIAFYDLENDGLPAHSSDVDLIGSARTAKVTIMNGTRNQSLLESENPLAEAGVTISGDDLEIFCSSEMDCLVLTYDCLNSDILHSFYIHSNNTKVMRIAANRPYFIAFFKIDNNTDSLDGPLERHPGKVMSDVIAHSEESSAATTTPVMADLSSLATDPVSEEYDVTGIEHNGSSFIVITSSASTVIFVLVLVLCGIIGAVIFWHKESPNSKLVGIEAEKSSNPSSVEPVEEFQEVTNCKQNSRECKGLEEQLPGFNDHDEVSYTAVDDNWEVTVDNVAYQHLQVAHVQPVYAQVAPQQALSNQVGDKFIPVDYAILDHEKLVTNLKVESVELEKKETTPALPPKSTPLNMDTLHTLLTPAASKWYEIGLAMGLTEDTLDDEVHPGNSTDWLRLREICGLYCESKHSWEEVVHLLWEVEEWEIADRVHGQERLLATEGVHPPLSFPPKAAD